MKTVISVKVHSRGELSLVIVCAGSRAGMEMIMKLKMKALCGLVSLMMVLCVCTICSAMAESMYSENEIQNDAGESLSDLEELQIGSADAATKLKSFPAEGPITFDELLSWSGELKSIALSYPLLNNPRAEEASSEDGNAFQYSFGTVYADAAALTAETPVNAFVIMDESIPAPRGITVSMSVNDLMARIPCENAQMKGSYTESVLYLQGDASSGYCGGLVLRDGQRIRAMEYTASDPESHRVLSLTFLISGDGIDAIRLSGMNDEVSAAEMEENAAELAALQPLNGYSRVFTSYNGSELQPFSPEDLVFSGIDYLTLRPEQLEGEVEDVLIDNGDGTFLRRVDGEGYEAVFTCDSEGKNAVLVSFTFLSDNLEGPRAVRLGDYFQEDFNRFRNGEGAFNDAAMTEVLYGDPELAESGMAEYNSGDGMVLRYSTAAPDGRIIALYLHYRDTVLDEIIVYTADSSEE